jgi:hypothetical protein
MRRLKPTAVLLLWDGPISDDAAQEILAIDELYLLRVPPLSNSSLIAGE